MREKGTIKRYNGNRGFGFISHLGTPDLFFHCTQVGVADGQVITEGMEVEFETEATSKGLMAIRVTLL